MNDSNVKTVILENAKPSKYLGFLLDIIRQFKIPFMNKSLCRTTYNDSKKYYADMEYNDTPCFSDLLWLKILPLSIISIPIAKRVPIIKPFKNIMHNLIIYNCCFPLIISKLDYETKTNISKYTLLETYTDVIK